MAMNSQMLPAGTVLRGRAYSYTVEKVLGQGSFGITYMASTSIAGPLGEVTVQVALKEFFAKELDVRQEDGTVSARSQDGIAHKYARAFQRESENISKLKHPGIVNVLEAFEANGTFYYSMEYLSGGSLDEKVKGTGIPEAEALKLIKMIGSGLAYMHEKKVMHLDLKPKNVMLKGSGAPVIIDFGLSKQYDREGEPESSSTIGMGTPGYAPLEQVNPSSSQAFQPTLDIYALGATLYKMLTGKTPPSASSILEVGLPEADLVSKGVSSGTIAAIRAAMQPSRLQRPQSVGAFLTLLDAGEKFSAADEDDTIVSAPAAPVIQTETSDIKPQAPLDKPAESSIVPEEEPQKPKSRIWALVTGTLVVAGIIGAIIFGGGKEEQETHVDSLAGFENGHEWVDLGLSVKWATCNVGASSPSDYGNYYSWGETSSNSNQSSLPFFDYNKQLYTKYNTKSKYGPIDNKTRLELSDDEARMNWGGKWRMPTKMEFEELLSECTCSWITMEGKNGYLVTSKKNKNSIFLPAAGRWDTEIDLIYPGVEGWYWSSNLDADYPYSAWCFLFNSSYSYTETYSRPNGFTIRPVFE